VLYDTQYKAQEVRKMIVTYVTNHWEDYSIMSHDSDGNNYRSSASSNPQFLQIYFVGNDERETLLRCSNSANVKKSLVKQLPAMLHHNNPYIKDLKSTSK